MFYCTSLYFTASCDINACNAGLWFLGLDIKSLSISDERRRLLETKTINLQERDNNIHIGYTINKGDKIGLCIDDDENTLFFVVLHELAHVITRSYGHDDKFWKNFEFLIKQAVKLNIYDYQNYNKTSINYCNKDITYTPHIQDKNK